MDVLSRFVEAFLILLAPIVTSLVTAWVVIKVKEAAARLKESRPDLAYYLEVVAGIAVKSAEQSKLGGFVTDKKAYAIDLAEKFLANYGITMDIDLIDAAIEAAVWEELNKGNPAKNKSLK